MCDGAIDNHNVLGIRDHVFSHQHKRHQKYLIDNLQQDVLYQRCQIHFWLLEFYPVPKYLQYPGRLIKYPLHPAEQYLHDPLLIQAASVKYPM